MVVSTSKPGKRIYAGMQKFLKNPELEEVVEEVGSICKVV